MSSDVGGDPAPSDAQQGMGLGVVLALVAMGLSVIVLAQDFSALNVSLSAIERAFDTDITTVQWVINAYALVFAIMLVAGGRFADMFGRRRVFFIGMTLFAVMSTLGGLAPNVYLLIAARAVMGIGGALMSPAILGMTYTILPPQKAGLAGGLIIGAAGIGQAIGPISGGLLTELLDWRWVLLVNLPIAAVAMLVTWREVHQPGERGADQHIDWAGIATLSVGLLALLFALDQGVDWGWADPRIVLSLVVSVALIVAFLFVERGAGRDAVVPRDVMSNREFTAACIAITLVAPTFFATLLYVPQFLQRLLGFSPIQAGLGMLPMMIPFAAVSFVGGQLYDRLGAKAMASAGAFCLALGPFLLSLVGQDAGFGALVPGTVVVGIGLGLFFSSATTAGVTAADPSRTSLAGALMNMFQIAGGSIGLGLTTTIFASSSLGRLATDLAALGSALSPAQVAAIQGILAGTESAQQALGALSPDLARRALEVVRDAFTVGFQNGMRVDALLALVATASALAYVGGRLGQKGKPAAAEQSRGPAGGA